jgi:metal-dependent amidase/aminoacylase/carboxypeptidase family protein
MDSSSFKSTYESLLDKKILNKVIAFRQLMHQNAEGHLQEYITQRRIKQILTDFGITQVKECAGTGLIVDIDGKGEAKREELSIAIRADIDGLKMSENNPHLPYASKT